jgi:hypothetical protein
MTIPLRLVGGAIVVEEPPRGGVEVLGQFRGHLPGERQ